MNTWIYILVITVIYGITMYLGIMFREPDSKWNKKRFWNKVRDIEYTCRKLKTTEINVENKGSLFCVRAADGKGIESIDYSSPYRVTDIYINDELVCKVHRLKNLFTTYITLEYAKERSRNEIDEIIMKAYKISKQKLNEYYKINGYGDNSKSFYSN
jgi:hypothetical protein